MAGTACAAASLLTVMRTSSDPACASCATWMAVASGIGGVGVRHRLDDDRVRRADRHATDEHGGRRPPQGQASWHRPMVEPCRANRHERVLARDRDRARRRRSRSRFSARLDRRGRAGAARPGRRALRGRAAREPLVFRTPLPFLLALRDVTTRRTPSSSTGGSSASSARRSSSPLATGTRVCRWSTGPGSTDALPAMIRDDALHAHRRQGRWRRAVRACGCLGPPVETRRSLRARRDRAPGRRSCRRTRTSSRPRRRPLAGARLGQHVELDLGVEGAQVAGAGQDLALEGEGRDGGLHRPGCTEGVPVQALRARDRQPAGVRRRRPCGWREPRPAR